MFGLATVSLAALVVSAAGQATTATRSATPAAGSTPGFTPLAQKHFDWNNLPYQADTDNGERGTQSGYNRCNSTTEGPKSQCQTLVVNSVDDFCVWGPPNPNGVIGDIEGESVAYCTKPGYGTRLIPSGALKGVQFMRTPDYVQVVGFIDQKQINIKASDGGGELDPHGADRRGNPLGGLVFSTAWGNGFVQVLEWHNFMGSDMFCIKACDPRGANDNKYCDHIYDRIGCEYNAPASYDSINGVFESCLGDDQDFPGIYTGADGQITTYHQPPESAGDITNMPYTPKVPASSSCTTFQSAALYTGLPSAAGVSTSSGPAQTASTTKPAPQPASPVASTTGNSAAAAGVHKLTDAWFVSAVLGVVGAGVGAVLAL